MTDASRYMPYFTEADFPEHMSAKQIEANRFTESTLERHKRQGMVLAVRTRWVALGLVALLLPVLNPNLEVLYYHGLLGILALIGWAQLYAGQVGRSFRELGLMFLDLSIMAFALVFPNPFSTTDWPTAVGYQFNSFQYFFIILAAGTMAYSWRTVGAIGTWTAGLWAIGVGMTWYFGKQDPALGEAIFEAIGRDERLFQVFNPNSVDFEMRLQEIVVFVIVAFILSVSVRRFNRLLLRSAALERERENLGRYFSPNVVDELSQNDEPLKSTRTHDVAVLFVDIVGFTKLASERDPADVIRILRQFHATMEREVFRYGGTLDKYLGDGLMATFGTPTRSDLDAISALRSVRGMMASLHALNADRRARGEAELRGSFGLHYGPVVLGDIGANRLEFAVIGNTVNIANRLEKRTRNLGAEVVISDALITAARAEAAPDDPALDGWERHDPIDIRGADAPLAIWTLSSIN
ncbi:MAG: adenylate/guanylate cyclase domain-containing protein [Arenibacterium sp.]